MAAEVQAVASGALPEFPQLYQAYRGKVLAYATKLLGGGEAEDVAQEVFVKVERSLASLADPTKLGSWIYAITLNTVRDVARKRAAGIERLAVAQGAAGEGGDGEAAIARVPDPRSRSPEEAAIRHEMIACYLDYVGRLAPTHYEVYVLSEFEHLTNDEIARRLGLSLATVKIRLHRARARLYDELRRNCRCYVNERGELMGEPRGTEEETR
jgi:RNA polymerase sigma-70 factor (ECF subfamily)